MDLPTVIIDSSIAEFVNDYERPMKLVLRMVQLRARIYFAFR